MIIAICGSIEFSPQIIELKEKLEALGHDVRIPLFTQKIMEGELTMADFLHKKGQDGGDINIRQAQPVDLIKRYWEIIKNSDAILVLNIAKKGIDNYIGGNTLMEMGYAYGFDKKIFLYNPVPARGERLHYVDEILAMQPVVIDGDLSKIRS